MDYIKSKFANFILLCFISAALLCSCSSGGASGRSVVGLPDPIQQEATGSTSLYVDDYNVTVDYKYSYDISALVISAKEYGSYDLPGKLAPKDAALAWGVVAEYNDRINFNWSQSGRWYYWRTDAYTDIEPVGGVDGVTAHSSNNHLIPADDNVKKLVKKIKAGDCIRIKGYLVNVSADDGKGNNFWWNSSTARTDTGDGACEVIYVTNVEWLDK